MKMLPLSPTDEELELIEHVTGLPLVVGSAYMSPDHQRDAIIKVIRVLDNLVYTHTYNHGMLVSLFTAMAGASCSDPYHEDDLPKYLRNYIVRDWREYEIAPAMSLQVGDEVRIFGEQMTVSLAPVLVTHQSDNFIRIGMDTGTCGWGPDQRVAKKKRWTDEAHDRDTGG